MDSVARGLFYELDERVKVLEGREEAVKTVAKECRRVINLLGRLRSDLRLLPEFEKRIPPIGELPLALAGIVNDPKLGEAIEASRLELGLRPGKDW